MMVLPLARCRAPLLAMAVCLAGSLVLAGDPPKVPAGEVESIRHAAARGDATAQFNLGYLPEIDHCVPPDVSWANFCDYIGYLKHRLGRG